MVAGLLAGKEVTTMSDAEVALELLKLELANCSDAAEAAIQKETFLRLYRECLATVRGKEA